MIFWAILTLILVLVAVAITISLVQRYDQEPEASGLAILLAQLGEVDAQEKSGVISEATAEQMRVDIKRRILAEGHAPKARLAPFGSGARAKIAFATVAVVTIVTMAVYALRGAPEQTGAAPPTAQQAALGAGEHPAGDAEAMVRSLEERLKAAPEDAEGWRMLGWSYFQLRRFSESADAYARARKLIPDEPSFTSAMAESMVQAANGTVTPEARKAFDEALKMDPTDPRARYFIAVHKEQQGDARGAIDDWIALLKDSPADAPWSPHLRQTIVDAAVKADIDVSARLPAVPEVSAAQPGPSQADIEAASRLSEQERSAMVQSMVDSLAAKLAENPRDADGWMRLMRARTVLEDRAGAGNAYRTALQTFSGDAAVTAQLRKAAQDLGIN